MDTKSKSTNLARGVFSWFCFLLIAFSLIFGVSFTGFYAVVYGGELFEYVDRNASDYRLILSGELRELDTYKESASSFFQRLYYSATNTVLYAEDAETAQTEDGNVRVYVYSDENTAVSTVFFDTVSKDNLYRITDFSTGESGRTVTNAANWDGATLPADFNYLFRYENGVVTISHKNADGTLSVVYDSSEPGSFYTDTLAYMLDSVPATAAPLSLTFAVRSEATSFSASNEIIGSAQSYANQMLFQLVFVSAIVVLYVLLLILSFLFRSDRKLFETYIAHGLKWIWIEIKLAVVLVWTGACAFLVIGGMFPLAVSICVALCALFFMFYLLGVDISHNRRIYRHNIIHSIFELVLANKHGLRFERIVYRKYMATLGVLAGLLLLTVAVTLLEPHFPVIPFLRGWTLPTFYAAMTVSAAGTLIWFAFALRDDLRDYGKLMEQVEKMYRGDLNAVNTLPPTSALYGSAMQLNMIRDGIKLAVEEGIKSERTKVELITNVSHDIKTPLTSIITYVELLKTEPDLPPHVMDYVQIISQKSDRLRHMLQDVFDVSKAATGNITLSNEYIRLDKLLQQTLADMETVMEESPLEWRIKIDEKPCSVYADGQRIYRVFQNLIKNASQYALDGSRVYITLTTNDTLATVTIQNISKYEMKLDGEALTARFVRGDDSRTTSGSGLGLSIAKSFMEACGGTFKVDVKGDLFTAEITLPIKTPPAVEEAEDVVEKDKEAKDE